MKKVLLGIVFLVFLSCSGCKEGNNNHDNNSDISSNQISTTETNNTVIEIDRQNSDEDYTTSTDSNYKIVTDNPFDYLFRYIDDEYILYYIAPVTGIYRFDLDTNDVTLDYNFRLYDSINNELINVDYSSYYHGDSKKLTKGEEYKIVLSQIKGFPKATVKIGIPNELQRVDNNKISGTIKYRDQENSYTFTTNVSGYYRFDFSITDVKCNYRFILKDKINNVLVDEKYSTYTNGVNKYLDKNEEYSIQILYEEGFVDYDILIHEPQNPKKITESFSGKIEFIGQENTYYFTPKETGTYWVSIDFGNKDGSCKFLLSDNKNTELVSTYSENKYEVVLNKGVKYTFVVSYNNLMMDYDVIIT